MSRNCLFQSLQREVEWTNSDADWHSRLLCLVSKILPMFCSYFSLRTNLPHLFFCCCFCSLFLAGPKDLLSDRCILSCPSMDLVTCLLDFRLNFASNRSIVPRLAASLAACAQLSALGRCSLKIKSLCLKLK